MFNKDFFPTPIEVLHSMQIDCVDKVVLEPSAGKGDIIDYLKEMGAKAVLSCEINTDLAEIVKKKSKFIKDDFLKVKASEISHIDLIVMNPPFSKGARHIIHAWEVAPDGCEIISLVNYETIDNNYSRERSELKTIIKDYGTSQNLGNVFDHAERKTNVEVGLIRLFKPSRDEREFEGFFMDEEIEVQENGIMPFNSIRDVVQRYVYSVKCFEEHEAISNRMNDLNKLFNVGTFTFEIGYDKGVSTKEDYKIELQKQAWKYIFSLMKLDKYVTSGVMKDINSFVENQKNVPFTMKNIYKMCEIIAGTRQHTFNKSLEEVVDYLTRHTHENRYNVEGWKTNSGYLLNRKIIIPYMFEYSWGGYLSPSYSRHRDGISDLIKVICNIVGENYDNIEDLYNFCSVKKMQPNEWHDWGFFEIKGFKKGTIHMKFKDEKTWAAVNQAYAKIKGFTLPETIKKAA